MCLAEDPHTLATLFPDLILTTIIAGFGLMGAYVTRGAESEVYEESRPPRAFRKPRRSRGEVDDDDLVPRFPEPRGKWRDYDDDYL